MKLFAAGVSHKTAPIEVREQLAVQRNEIVDLAHYLKWFGHLDEIVLLSTCNRVEIYGTTQQTTRDVKSLFQFLTSEELDIGPHTYAHEDVDAVRHLFRVTAGLDSMMLGETEIAGQIKRAYETALAAGLTGRVLNRLFQKSFQVAKEIRTHTGIGRGTVSIKSTAVELIENALSDEVGSKSIMVIGAGQMAERCVQSLVSKGVPSIFVSSRSFDRAIDLTTRCGGEAICFGDCLFEMRDVDVVVAATSSGQTLLGLDDIENLMKSRCNRPLLLIDLSVPRNIDSAAGRLENVILYNIDDLEALTREGAQARERELAACHQIIEAQLAPLIEKLHTEDERFEGAGRSRTSCYSFEIAEKVPYELATPPGLVVQTSQ
jgi:glutamyl-tRNA reductase